MIRGNFSSLKIALYVFIPLEFLLFFVSFLNSENLVVVNKKISWGYKKTDGRVIDAVIIHSTYNASGLDSFSVAGVLDQFKTYGVSAHYLIDRKGTVYQLVEEKNIAFHAGVSSLPDGRTNVNATSIGIELVVTKHTSPTDIQYKHLAELLSSIKKRYTIKYVKGHSEIAPERKSDPWNFDWQKFNLLVN